MGQSRKSDAGKWASKLIPCLGCQWRRNRSGMRRRNCKTGVGQVAHRWGADSLTVERGGPDSGVSIIKAIEFCEFVQSAGRELHPCKGRQT